MYVTENEREGESGDGGSGNEHANEGISVLFHQTPETENASVLCGCFVSVTFFI